jgi:hypothetical protein
VTIEKDDSGGNSEGQEGSGRQKKASRSAYRMKGFFIGVLMRAFCALFAQHGGSKIILRHPVTEYRQD